MRQAVVGDARFDIVAFDQNRGVATARNYAVSTSTEPWIAFVDADDVLDDAYLSSMKHFVECFPGFDMYHCNLYVVSPGVKKDVLFSEKTEPWSTTFPEILDECVLALGGTWVRRDVFEALGGFHEEYLCEDYDFFIRFVVKGYTQIMNPLALYSYRLRPQVSRSSDAVASAYAVSDLLGSLEQDTRLSLSDRALVTQARAKRIASIASLETAVALERQASLLREKLASIFGPSLADVMVRTIHVVSPLIRPIRKRLIERHARTHIAERTGTD